MAFGNIRRPGGERATAGDTTEQNQLAELAASGLSAYRRTRHLPRLIPLWPDEMSCDSAAATERIIRALKRALRAERSRGRSGHWTYDLNRHAALALALRAECSILARQRRRLATPGSCPPVTPDQGPPVA